MVAAAIIGGSVISAGASMFGSSQQSNAANKANKLLQPYSALGLEAKPGLEGLLGMNGQNMLGTLEKTPGYQFTLGQGLESVQNGYAARGLGSSGAAMKGAANYAEGLAQNTYQGMFNNYLNLLGVGANAAAGQGSNLIGGANAQAAGLVGASNSLGNIPSYMLLNNAIGGGSSGLGALGGGAASSGMGAVYGGLY